MERPDWQVINENRKASPKYALCLLILLVFFVLDGNVLGDVNESLSTTMRAFEFHDLFFFFQCRVLAKNKLTPG